MKVHIAIIAIALSAVVALQSWTLTAIMDLKERIVRLETITQTHK